MATKAEVDRWKDLNRTLTAALNRSIEDKNDIIARIKDNYDEMETAKAVADGLEWQVEELQAENAELRNLVSGLMCCPVYQDDCAKCKHVKVVTKEETGNWPRYICTLCERAKEMGIEEDV